MLENLPTYEEIYHTFAWDIPQQFNMAQAVCSNWAQSEPERTALLRWNESGSCEPVSYGELERQSNQFANGLSALGISAGDRVAIILPQSKETLIGHLAIYKLGAIAVPMARLFAEDALQYRLAHSGCRCAITDAQGVGKLTTIAGDLPELKTVIVVEGGGSDDAPKQVPYSPTNIPMTGFAQVLSDQPDHIEPAMTSADDPALIIYTSGTTGPPKGALHAHRVLLGHIPGLKVHHEFIPQPGDIAWTPADWAWAGGLLNILMPCLMMGVPVVYGGMHRFDPQTALDLMESAKVTCAFLPPTVLRLMKTLPDIRQSHNLALRTISSGGEALGKETCLWAQQQLGASINEIYGQTECNLVLGTFGAKGIAKPGSIGKPVPGHKVALINDEGAVCKTGEVGEVAIQRPDPVMFLGYWHNDEATSEKFLGDWMLTGDQCYQDDEGYYHFVGRDDDIISTAGLRVGPSEIEDCLTAHEDVRLAACIGVPDALRGEIIKAYIVLSESGLTRVGQVDDLFEQLRQHVKQHMAANLFPRAFEIVEEIPLTTTGKVIRRIFRQQARDEFEQRKTVSS